MAPREEEIPGRAISYPTLDKDIQQETVRKF